jgi:hypothetical protein
MKSVKCMGIEKGIKKPGATNIAYDDNLTAGETHLLESAVQDMDTAVVRTTGAKNRGTVLVKETSHPTPLP